MATRTGDRHRALELEIDSGPGALRVTAVAPSILRLHFSGTGTWRPRRSWDVVELPDPATGVELDEIDGVRTLTTDALHVAVDRRGRLRVEDRSGRVLLEDPADDAGGPTYDRETGHAAWRHRMPIERRYYGFGERTGLLDK